MLPGLIAVSLVESVESLEREVADLEARNASREAEARAPAADARAQLERVKASLAEEETRLATFTAELQPAPARSVFTLRRAVIAAVSVGAFTFGAAAGELDLTHASVGLFGAVWLAFLAGALRGK